VRKSATLSPCRQYRYELWRDWSDDALELEEREGNNSAKFCMFIGLNPSTADETKDDPTIRKCIGFAKLWGYGALCMTNVFALRETDPKAMMKVESPVGENNQHHLLKNASHAGLVIAAWGKDGKHRNQDLTTAQWLSGIGVDLYCLRRNGDGSPGHPLYIPYTAKPEKWTP
jgi:hypothetical protein